MGRRWQGTNLGKLHEHTFPPKDMSMFPTNAFQSTLYSTGYSD